MARGFPLKPLRRLKNNDGYIFKFRIARGIREKKSNEFIETQDYRATDGIILFYSIGVVINGA